MSDDGKLKLFGISWDFDNPSGYSNIKCFQNPNLGKLHVEMNLLDQLKKQQNDDYIFASVIREYYLQGRFVIICPEEYKSRLSKWTHENPITLSIEDFEILFPKSILEKQKRGLLNLSRRQAIPGKRISGIYFYDFFARDEDECRFLIKTLAEKKWIKESSTMASTAQLIQGNFQILEKGWLEIEEIAKPLQSKQVFIARCFDEVMDRAGESIFKACKDSGFIPLQINKKEHNKEISGEILVEIKKSHFLIAEVTGQNKGVYFEAGFAMGIGIPVIWLVKEDDLENVHFDTRQYNHVVWQTEEELIEKLERRIKGSIV